MLLIGGKKILFFLLVFLDYMCQSVEIYLGYSCYVFVRCSTSFLSTKILPQRCSTSFLSTKILPEISTQSFHCLIASSFTQLKNENYFTLTHLEHVG